MKKASFSLLGLMAIIFAVASAFTIPGSKTSVRWDAFYLVTDAIQSSPLPSNSDADAERDGAVLHTSTTSSFEINAFATDCSDDTEHLCAAEVAYESNGDPSAGTIVDFVTGDRP